MKKRFAILAAAAVLAAAVVVVFATHHVIGGRLYRKNAAFLDLTGQEISFSQYEALAEKMPGTAIRWDVPFQGGFAASDSETLAVSSLTEEDAALLAFFSELKTLDARACSDRSLLPAVEGAYPELEVLVTLTLDGKTYDQDTKEIELATITAAELRLLPYLKQLQTVTVTEGGDASHFRALQEYCEDADIDFRVILCGQLTQEDVKGLTLSAASDNQVQLLALLPHLEEIHLPEPEAKPELLLSLVEALPDTKVTWEKTVLGLTFPQDAELIDLTPAIALGEGEVLGDKTSYDYALECKTSGTKEEKMASPRVDDKHPLPNKVDQTARIIAELEAAMGYFPKAEKLELYGAWLHNEDMAAFREAHREDYKVAWSVQCGYLATRTDATFFMPTKYKQQMNTFSDLEAFNLRYCEDIECIDLGHMMVTNLNFVEKMPNLKYLVLSWSRVRNLSALAHCKKLEFLEINWIVGDVDYSALTECTGLKDLNIGKTTGDITPILQMSWLENLWMVGWEDEDYRQAKEALPDTNIVYYFGDPVNGWRNIPNYYAMRDALYMFYMQG